MSGEKIKFICNDCGSDDVYRDAWTEWNIENQEWELQSTYDQHHCNQCENVCGVTEVII